MKFLDNIINKFFIDPLFSETRDGQKLNGYAEKQKYLQSKIDHLGENRTELISMSDKINILVESLDKRSNDLKNTKSKFQLLAENSIDVIWKTDFEYNTEYVSPSIFNLTGYTPEEFMQLHIKERHDLKTIDKLDKIFLDPSLRELTDTNETNITNIDGKIKHKDGRFIYIRIVCRPIFKGALFTGIQGTTSDTTDYVNFVNCQDMSLRVLHILNNDIAFSDSIELVLTEINDLTKCDAIGIRLKKGDDYPYFVQHGFTDDFLLTENSLISRDTNDSICRNSDGTVRLECTCGLVISGKTDPDHALFTENGSAWTNDSINAIRYPDEDVRNKPRDTCIHDGYLSVAIIPIKMKSKIVGILQLNAYRKNAFTENGIKSLESIANSIGEALLRKQTEDELHKTNQLLEGVLRTQTDCIARSTMTREVVYANRAYAIMFCGSEKAAKCRPINFLENVHPDDIDLVEKCTQEIINSDLHMGMIEYRVIDFEGNTRLFVWQAQGILNEAGEVYEIQAIGRDVAGPYRRINDR